MSGGATIIYLPDGQTDLGPFDPITWSEDNRLRAKWLNKEIGGPIFWHRERPFFEGLQTVNQSLVTGTWTEINIDWELKDSAGGHNEPSNVSYWNAPSTYYLADSPQNIFLCIGYVAVGAQATPTTVTTAFIKNDTEIHEGTKHTTASGASNTHATTGIAIDLLGLGPSDWVSLGGYSAAASINTTVSGKTSSLSVQWVGASAGYTTNNPSTPHSWISSDEVTADATGDSVALGGSKVPLNKEIRDTARFLNYPPYARLTAEGGSQSITSSTTAWTALKLPLQNLDSHFGWSSSSNTRYTFPKDGLYFVAGYYSSAETAASTGYRAVRLQVNGDANKVYGGNSIDAVDTTTIGSAVYAVHMIRVVAGDYVETQAQQTNAPSGTPTSLAVKTGSDNTCKMIVVWMSQ